MLPPVVGGQQAGQHGQQIAVAARAELEHRDAGRGVRHEHVQQPVAAVGRLAGELGALRRDVEYRVPATRVHPENLGFHPQRDRQPLAWCGAAKP